MRRKVKFYATFTLAENGRQITGVYRRHSARELHDELRALKSVDPYKLLWVRPVSNGR